MDDTDHEATRAALEQLALDAADGVTREVDANGVAALAQIAADLPSEALAREIQMFLKIGGPRWAQDGRQFSITELEALCRAFATVTALVGEGEQRNDPREALQTFSRAAAGRSSRGPRR